MSDDPTDPRVKRVKYDHWCTTTSGDTRMTTFTWKIEDFASRLEKTAECLYSSSFSAKKPNKEDSKWQLQLYPKGDKEPGTHLSIYVRSNNEFSVKAKYDVSILDSSMKKTNELKREILAYDQKTPAWGFKKWILRENLIKDQQLLPNGHLTILLELTVYGTEKVLSGSRNFEEEDKSKTRAKGLEQVSANLEKLFNDQEFSDVEIKCDGEVFHCHELILSTRSDVFRAMFQNDMTENRTKKVNIEDIDSKVLGEMLNFIYTGVPNEDVLEEKTAELLGAANQYQLEVLKSICEDRLCSSLEVSNSIEYLIFGDMYQASKLRRMSMRMVASNMASLVATEDYQNLVKKHKDLASEIPEAMVEVSKCHLSPPKTTSSRSTKTSRQRSQKK